MRFVYWFIYFYSNESDDIDHIVAMVTGLLDKPVLFVAEHPVGVEPRVQHLIKKLNYQQPEDVMLLGILGIGGIGKTTIAKAIYNRIHRHFDGCCFLPDIRESWEQSTSQVHLQERLLRDIYKKTKIRIHSVESGKIILQERLSRKRVLLILDDVDKPDQLKALCWNRKWFGPGSRIIITTRDEHLLKILKVDHVSRISKMDDTESIEQLSWHAFKQKKPKEDFVQLSKDVVAYCGGLPLALEVIGSFLIEKKAKEWQSAVEKLKRIPNSDVHKKLRISFDGLNDDAEREIFLDIAFFFIGMDRNDVIHVLEEHDAEIGISVLVDRSLVTVDNNNKLGMHDLLRDMGREIVREKSPKYPGRRCRLCLQNDVLDVLLKHTGTKDLEGLALRLPRTNSYCLETKAFMKMERLRLLQLANVKLEGNFEDLPKDLKWLYWHGFPFDYLPSNFYLASSIAIEFEFSSLRTWKDVQYMEKLKILNLSHSNLLTQTPNSSYLPNLEKLLLKDCPNLCEISDSIEKLTKILLIDLEDCKSLPNLRRSFYKLKSLKTLNISGCSMINKLEEDLEQMTSLITLIADKTGITQVPFSIVRSKSIGYISLCGYEGFSSDVFPSLIRSWMSPPGNLLSFVQTSACSELVPLDVQKLRLLSVKCSIDFQLTEGVTRILDTLCATYNKQLEATPTTSQVMNIRSLTAIDSCNQFRIWGPLLIEVGIKSQLTSNLRDRIIQVYL
ncbi:disease resistance protein RUN1-like [Arachis stenosperma]|uniref:disease resistance protein RUN1-like n=1 Tax=Arachis stenosperma TaxID=217475 RepID=UPI0025AD4F73|nr:disease resistance protein RUN1-like [Arachis stenosperma]